MPRKKAPKKNVKPRRARGTGSITWDSRRNCYLGRVPVGRHPNGRTRYVEVRAATQGELVAKMKAVAAPDPSAVTVKEWAERWLAGSGASGPTLGDYRTTVDTHFVPTLGTKKLAALTPHDVERALLVWRESLGPNTLRKALRQLRVMLEAARRAKVVRENVAAEVPTPKPQKVAIRPFTPTELVRIVTHASRRDRDAIYALLATLGCRIGEAAALDVTDLDRTGGTLSITKTYSGDHGTRRPKSENGIRTVRVPALALPAVLAAAGDRKTGPLFRIGTGGRIDHPAALTRWGRLLEEIGLDYRNPHQLRHSVATHALAAGASLPNVARDLGDSVQTIVKTYLHATAGPSVSDVMDRVLGGVSVASEKKDSDQTQ